MTLLKSENITMTLSGIPEPYRDFDADGLPVYRQDADEKQVVETFVRIQGDGEIHWPNREGEKFRLADVHQTLKRYGRTASGISLCWPATASVQGIGVQDEDDFYTFTAEPDLYGKVRILKIRSDIPGAVNFTFSGSSTAWRFKRQSLKYSSGDFQNSDEKNSLYQVGLTGPDGKNEIPGGRGFDVLVDAGKALIDSFGRPVHGDIFHIFAYGDGHDLGYPDYTPMEKLGGAGAFGEAVSWLKETGFEVSLYINPRLAEISRLKDYPDLSSSVCTDSYGEPLIEVYRGRDFAVMNPLSEPWRNHLLGQIGNLKNTGASWIQLDQVAGRSAPLAAGEIWGDGYQQLINEIHKLGMKVWIQGVSDYYDADAFEATWRSVSILDDGSLRGGWPLGVPDTTLIESAGFSHSLIVPENKRRALKESGLRLIQDRCCIDDTLPLWGESWIENLNSNNYSRVPGELNGGII